MLLDKLAAIIRYAVNKEMSIINRTMFIECACGIRELTFLRLKYFDCKFDKTEAIKLVTRFWYTTTT